MHQKKFIIPSLLLALALLLVACTPATAPAESEPADTAAESAADAGADESAAAPAASEGEKVVRVDTSSGKGTHFNPLYWIGTGSQYHTFMWIWPALTRADNNGQQIPNLAESFEASPDAMTWTFHLPEDAVWSDGTPLTADDVIFSYHRKLDPEFMGALLLDWVPAWHMARLGQITGWEAFANGEADTIAGITAPDEHTVVFELDEPSAVFPIGAQHIYTLPEHVLGDVPAEEYGEHPYVADNPDVVLGPLRLARYEVDEFIELERNPEWWGEQQLKIDRIIFYQSQEEQAHINRVLAGEQDIVMRGITADDLPLFEGEESLRIEPVLSLGWLAISTNARDHDYMTKELRQAMAYAIDKEALNLLLYDGQAAPVGSIILGPDWAIPDNLTSYERDVEKARQILEESGWDFDRTLRFLVFDAEDLAAPAIQQMLGEAGIQVELVLRSFTDASNIFAEGDYDFYLSGGGSAAADPSLSGSYVACGGSGTERLGYCNEELDALFAQGMTVPATEDRQPYYHDAARILNEELPYIPLFRTPLFYVINNRLQGITPAGSVDDLTWDIFEWDVVE